MHGEIVAPVHYLPEYLKQEPSRVLRGWRAACGALFRLDPGFLKPVGGRFQQGLIHAGIGVERQKLP